MRPGHVDSSGKVVQVSWLKEVVIEPWADALDDLDNQPRFWAAAIMAVVALCVAIVVFATVTVYTMNISAILGWFWLGSFTYWALRALWRKISETS